MVNGLSLTLRDAQHLCWKTYKKFEPKDKAAGASETAAGLAAKAGVLAEKLKGAEPAVGKEELAGLLSELLFDAFVLAEQGGVDLEEAFLQSVDDYILRMVK